MIPFRFVSSVLVWTLGLVLFKSSASASAGARLGGSDLCSSCDVGLYRRRTRSVYVRVRAQRIVSRLGCGMEMSIWFGRDFGEGWGVRHWGHGPRFL